MPAGWQGFPRARGGDEKQPTDRDSPLAACSAVQPSSPQIGSGERQAANQELALRWGRAQARRLDSAPLGPRGPAGACAGGAEGDAESRYPFKDQPAITIQKL
nr:UPF0538 protein C2orf76 homolog isoform X3 [Loxodonta africana]